MFEVWRCVINVLEQNGKVSFESCKAQTLFKHWELSDGTHANANVRLITPLATCSSAALYKTSFEDGEYIIMACEHFCMRQKRPRRENERVND